MSFRVAIVGRPNVGKSSLFNRLIGTRFSITDDAPGVTRDRIYGEALWLTKKFSLIDTGGIDIGDAPFLTQIKEQASIAIDEADVIIFVVDGKTGLADSDNFIAKILYKSEKPIVLAVNKIDDINQLNNAYEFYSLGLGDPFAVSSLHGIGIGDLLDEVFKYYTSEDTVVPEDTISFSIVGRPNVGKSSLTNAILGKNRVIVSEISGTTRDAIDSDFKRHGQKYRVIDTAGIRKRGKIYEDTEKYSILRALTALERSDVALLVLDGSEGIIEQDKHVAGYISDYNKAVVIVVNKWDIVLKDDKTMKKMTENIKDEFKFFDYAEIVFVSAKENERLNTIFEAINLSFANYCKQLTTSTINELIQDAVAFTPPHQFNHGVAKFTYSTQIGTKPPAFAIFVNDPDYVHFSYERYLMNQMRASVDFRGTPIKLLFRKKD